MVSGSGAAGHLSSVTRAQVIEGLRSRRITLVDVLSPESFATLHIPGAINIPVAELSRRAPELLTDRRAPIVVYCGGPT